MQRQVLVHTVQKTVELPQVQLLWCCKSYVSRAIQFDRVPDIPVVPLKGDSTVQFLNKVVDTVVYDSCPWFRQCRAVSFTDKVVDIPVLALKTVEVPQIQSSTELNDDLEAGLAHFFGLTQEGWSPGVRGFFEPSMV